MAREIFVLRLNKVADELQLSDIKLQNGLKVMVVVVRYRIIWRNQYIHKTR